MKENGMAVDCMIVREDESIENTAVDMQALSMRGAQREATGYMISRDYEPVGRWQAEATSSAGETLESVRTFRPKK